MSWYRPSAKKKRKPRFLGVKSNSEPLTKMTNEDILLKAHVNLGYVQYLLSSIKPNFLADGERRNLYKELIGYIEAAKNRILKLLTEFKPASEVKEGGSQ